MTAAGYSRVSAAREQMLAAARRLEQAIYADSGDPHANDEHTYAEELLATTALELVQAIDGMPAFDQPVGWRLNPPATVCPICQDLGFIGYDGFNDMKACPANCAASWSRVNLRHYSRHPLQESECPF
jgi:hypothetical protein